MAPLSENLSVVFQASDMAPPTAKVNNKPKAKAQGVLQPTNLDNQFQVGT